MVNYNKYNTVDIFVCTHSLAYTERSTFAYIFWHGIIHIYLAVICPLIRYLLALIRAVFINIVKPACVYVIFHSFIVLVSFHFLFLFLFSFSISFSTELKQKREECLGACLVSLGLTRIQITSSFGFQDEEIKTQKKQNKIRNT